MRALSIGFIALALSWVAYMRTDGFSVERIRAPLIKSEEKEIEPQIRKILSQKFSYLTRGRQCFVFASQDGDYVIKFFNYDYLKVPWYAIWSEKQREKRAIRTHFYENSYEIAFKEFKEEILYLHLGPSLNLPKLEIKDRASRRFSIDLNETPFVLQRRGRPFYEVLLECYQNEGLESLKQKIDAFQTAVLTRMQRGIADADSDVEHNWGFVEDRLFHLDPGRLYYDQELLKPDRRLREWRSSTRKFHRWLEKNIPEAILSLEDILLDANELTH